MDGSCLIDGVLDVSVFDSQRRVFRPSVVTGTDGDGPRLGVVIVGFEKDVDRSEVGCGDCRLGSG